MSRFADITTLRVGGRIKDLRDAHSEDDLIDAVRSADADKLPLLVMGGGSNLLASDGGFDGVVVRDKRADVTVQDDGFCGGVSATATAGVRLDDFVKQGVIEEWVGMESLSGIPGNVGATPIQNVGAYGTEMSDVISSVRVWDREESRKRTFAWIDCGFGYRDSVFKRSLLAGHVTPRYVVLDVTVQMRWGTRSMPITYPGLAKHLDIEVGGTAPTAEVRDAVLQIRGSKGMVLNAADHDTWSAGSFFTNPILNAEQAAKLPAEAPRFPVEVGAVTKIPWAASTTTASNDPDLIKTSAAWLIEQAGFTRGFALNERASLSTKHTLALTNRGDASASDILELARHIRAGVRERFGITLVPEPILVGLDF